MNKVFLHRRVVKFLDEIEEKRRKKLLYVSELLLACARSFLLPPPNLPSLAALSADLGRVRCPQAFGTVQAHIRYNKCLHRINIYRLSSPPFRKGTSRR